MQNERVEHSGTLQQADCGIFQCSRSALSDWQRVGLWNWLCYSYFEIMEFNHSPVPFVVTKPKKGGGNDSEISQHNAEVALNHTTNSWASRIHSSNVQIQ